MMNLNHYLEAAKAEELVAELQAQGYETSLDTPPYNLVAIKNGSRLAFAIRGYDTFTEKPTNIPSLSERARQEGYTGFQLVLVSPPREKTIQIEGLREALFQHIATHYDHVWQDMAQYVQPVRIRRLDVDTIEVTPQGMDVTGSGGLRVDLTYGDAKHNFTFDQTYPFTFHVMLDHDRHILEDKGIEIDTDV